MPADVPVPSTVTITPIIAASLFATKEPYTWQSLGRPLDEAETDEEAFRDGTVFTCSGLADALMLRAFEDGNGHLTALFERYYDRQFNVLSSRLSAPRA